MEDLELLIEDIKKRNNKNIILETDVSREFKEDIFYDLFRAEFFKKYYSTFNLGMND